MKQRKNADRGGHRAKDLTRKKLSVSQQAAVKGGFADGSRKAVPTATRLPATEWDYIHKNHMQSP